MQRLKASVDRRIAAAQEERGLVIVHTGAGKGKTTAAFGMALRCIGHGMKVAIVQFIKGAIDTAEERVLKSFTGQVVFLRMGEGYTWETQDRTRDIAFAQRAWEAAAAFLRDPDYAMVILDEFNIALQQDYVALGDVLPVLAARPPMQHVVITGRGAKKELVEAADLVTEMGQLKHPFRKGVKAQKGVEF
jgi:cob(I)alamin adenosyltransferase